MNQKKTPKRKTKPTPPRAVREFTAGGVVFRRTHHGPQILMIQDRAGRWTIPKGHVEKGESLEQTALREVAEETGLKEMRILDKLGKIYFFYRKDGKLIFMTNYVYLMEASGQTDEVVPENSEGIADVKWFDYEEAIEKVEYKDTQKLFRQGMARVGI